MIVGAVSIIIFRCPALLASRALAALLLCVGCECCRHGERRQGACCSLYYTVPPSSRGWVGGWVVCSCVHITKALLIVDGLNHALRKK